MASIAGDTRQHYFLFQLIGNKNRTKKDIHLHYLKKRREYESVSDNYGNHYIIHVIVDRWRALPNALRQ